VRVTGANTVAIRQPTFHIVAKDVGFSYPLAANPHLLITGRYSCSTDNKHELVFRHVFPTGQAATWELLQSCRTAAHATIKQRIGINLLYIYAIGDTITIVIRKTEKQQGEWKLTCDIRVRFPSARATSSPYEQHNTQHHNRNTQGSRLMSYTCQVCSTFIPTGPTSVTS